MSPAPNSSPASSIAPRDRTLILASVVVSLVALVASWYGVRTAEYQVLQYEAETGARNWARFLTEDLDNLSGILAGQPLSGEDRTDLEAVVRVANMVRYKIFGSNGRIVHASQPSEIGKSEDEPYFTGIVMKGRTYAQIVDGEDFEAGAQTISEAYVPIMRDGRFLGAIEVYTDVTARAAELRRLGNYALGFLVTLLLFVGATMGVVVTRNIRGHNAVQRDLMAREMRLRATQSELIDAKEKAEAASVAKSQFLATMSHELRTPMNGIMGMADLLSRTEIDETQQHFISTIVQSSENLLKLINQILDFSRIEAGEMDLDRVPYDLHDVVNATADLLAKSADEKRLDFVVLIADDTPRYVSGDPARLRQILTNLVGNAIKFTSDGEVVLSVWTDKRTESTAHVCFSVRDTGIGIPADAMPKLFEAFAQGDSSITRQFGGTGLGLSISQRLAHLMGGHIVVRSEPGKGTRFRVTLPMSIAPRPEADAEPAGESLQGGHALIVDDNQTNRDVLAYYLDGWGVGSEAVDNADAAIQVLSAAAQQGMPFDIAILDMMMPGMSGLDLARAISSNPQLSRTKMVLLTSMTWRDDQADARKAGVSALLQKPVRRAQLQRALAKLRHEGDAPPATSADPAPPAPAKAQRAAPTAKRWQGIRVLMAEDNPINQQVQTSYLAALGCEVDVATTGLEAVEVLGQRRYDVVLMDCQMPELDGMEATRLIRRREQARDPSQRMPIVAVTANAFDEDREACLASGMDDCLTKPFTQDQLEEVLTRWLDEAAGNGADGRAVNS
jgi:signal transduction histidine kinase/CheY-like chemotaxis protein